MPTFRGQRFVTTTIVVVRCQRVNYNLKKNVQISQERRVEISESVFKILNDTCLSVIINEQLLITGLRSQVLWDVIARS